MLAIRPSKPSPQQPPLYTPHLLPAHISHNGSIPSSTHYFTPSPLVPTTSSTDPKPTPTASSETTSSKDTPTPSDHPHPPLLHAHLRGRHLHGVPLALPPTHQGAVLVLTDAVLPTHTSSNANSYNSNSHPYDSNSDAEDEDDDDDMDATVEVKVAQQVGCFEEIVLWGHGGVVGEGDKFRRGVEEWVGWAETMHKEEEGEE